MLNALSLTLDALTSTCRGRSAEEYKRVGRTHRTLGTLVNPLMDHSSKPGGESIAVTFAFSTNGSLMMFTVKPLPFLTLIAVSLIRVGPFEQEKETRGGQLVTWT